MKKLDSLQGLRFIGFLLIYLTHAGWILWKPDFFNFGERGVEIFFVLSGYLIAYNYRDTNLLYDFKSSVKYMFGKLQKFYFLHILTFLIVLYYMERHGFNYSHGFDAFIRDIILNITLLQSWYEPARFSFNGVTWFLSSILFIYFCVPYIIHFFRRNRGGYWVLFLLVFLMKLSCDTLRYGMGLNPWPGVFDWYSNPTYRLLDFLLGYIGFLLFNNYSGKLKVSKLEITLFQWGILLFYFVACRIFDKLWVPAVFLILVVLLVYAFTLSGGIFNIFFGNKLIVHLGNISFELFIIHQVIIKIMYAKLE